MNNRLLIVMVSLLSLFGCKSSPKITEEISETGIKLSLIPALSISSGASLNFIPVEPERTIDKETAIRLIEIISKHFPNKEIEIHIDSIISFIVCGDGLDKISCPFCNKEVSQKFWQESMDQAFQTRFFDRKIKTPCCNKFVDLNDLKYNQECGFSKLCITVKTPDISDPNGVKPLLVEMEKLSKIKFKIINTNY
jgi:hypothetical protein